MHPVAACNPGGSSRRINRCMETVSQERAPCLAVRLAPAGETAIIWRVGFEGREMKGIEDEVLVRRVATGDERALSDLYDRYAGVVYGAGLRYLADRGAAEDLVQDVFVSVWRGAEGYDPDKARFATWIFRITRNRATDLIRRRRARVRTVGEDALKPPLEPGEEDSTGRIARSFDVTTGLSRLSPDHREVLVLAYLEGLTQREISERIDTPLGTVKSRTTAALRSLRENMLPEVPEEPSDG